MKAIIPLAAENKNLFPINGRKPLGLIKFGGKCLAERHIETAESLGAEEVNLICNHEIDQYKSKFRGQQSVKIKRQEELGGTGSAVKKGIEPGDETILVILGNQYVEERDVRKTVERIKHSDSKASVLGDYKQKPRNYGVLSIEDDRVEGIKEKPEEPRNTLVSAGVYCFDSTAQQYIGEKMSESISNFASNHDVNVELVSKSWEGVQNLSDIKQISKYIRDEIPETRKSESARISDSAEIEGNAIISEGAEIKAGAVVQGSCYIGSDARIGPNSVVENSSIESGSVIEGAAVRGTKVCEGSTIEDHVSVQDSVVAEGCTIRPGTSIYRSYIGPGSLLQDNNSIREKKIVPDARTDLNEIVK